jgi:hypothetical protein
MQQVPLKKMSPPDTLRAGASSKLEHGRLIFPT